MKFLSVRDLRGKAAQIWKELPEQKELVVTNNGRPIAILSSVTASDLEESLSAIRQARAIQAVAAMQRRSVEKGTDKITLKEINAEIKAARRGRSK